MHPAAFPSELIERLRRSRCPVVLTGAGISAESGVPTFRDAQTGLWAQYDPMQLATPQAFAANPKLVWEWYAWRRELVARAAPNPAHYALARLAQHIPGLILVTQNVDGLHQQAGSPLVIELHGNLTRTICARERIVIQAWESGPELPPRCPGCGSYLRPDVVWFGEPLPGEALETAFQAARLCDLFFSIGTSSLVEPAAQLPYMAIHAGSPVVEINPQETPLSASAAYVLRGPAGAILPGLVDQL